MGSIEDRLKRLEGAFGIVPEKEPTTYEEFLEVFPDWEDLKKEQDSMVIDEISKLTGLTRRRIGDKEALKVAEEDPKPLDSKKIQRVKKCMEYYYKLHPDGIEHVKDMEEMYKMMEGMGIHRRRISK